MPDRVVAVVPAAGRGARMGGATPKQFLSLGGVPILVHTLRVLASVDSIHDIIIAIPEADRLFCQEHIVAPFGITKVAAIVAGGRRRQDSVRNGMLAIREPADFVLVHDGVRPFVSAVTVAEAVRVAQRTGASVVAAPMKDTVKRVNAQGVVVETLNREELWLAQTPQVFRFAWLREAHDRAEREQWDATDDAGLVEQVGYPVTVVEGSSSNLKITRPEDLALGEAILSCAKD